MTNQQYPPPPQQYPPPPPQMAAPQQMAPQLQQQMSLEQFVYSQVAPYLGQGEQVYDTGVCHQVVRSQILLRKKVSMIRTYLVAITQFRIVLIETGGKLFGGPNGAPKLENRGMVVHNLNAIQSARYRGVERIGIFKMKPLLLHMHDGTSVEYAFPSLPKPCASQPALSTYPARLEYFLSTRSPLPNGPLPPVPDQVKQQWAAEAAADYSKKQGKLAMIAGAAVLIPMLFGAVLPPMMMAMGLIPSAIVLVFSLRRLLLNAAQRSFVKGAGFP